MVLVTITTVNLSQCVHCKTKRSPHGMREPYIILAVHASLLMAWLGWCVTHDSVATVHPKQ